MLKCINVALFWRIEIQIQRIEIQVSGSWRGIMVLPAGVHYGAWPARARGLVVTGLFIDHLADHQPWKFLLTLHV
ncbi:hypothetical protein [Halomonas cupida]|uniref:hypothetical protein n=1 Tax=Halomonas cupida TaxID=44933 RepID=UPI003A936EB9